MRLIRLLKRDLAHEISTWIEKGFISTDQAQQIYNLYGIDHKNHSNSSATLVVLAYLFIGLALITLIGANWDEIPRGLRMSAIFVTTIATQLFALKQYYSKVSSNTVHSAIVLFFLGNLFFGVAIILIAQIYHLGEHMPNGIFWWALGTLPFGVLLRSSWLTVFSNVLALIWFLLELSLDFYPMLFPIFIVAALYTLIRSPSNTALCLITAASISLWIEATLALFWSDESHVLKLLPEHFVVSIALFIFVYAGSNWLYARNNVKARDYGALLLLWALRFNIFIMFVLTFERYWELLIEYDWKYLTSMGWIISMLLGSSLWLGWKMQKLSTLVPVVLFYISSVIITVLMGNPEHTIYFQVVYNIALVAIGIWLIVRGLQGGVSHYFFSGTAIILLVGFIRYIDLIGDYIGTSILFIFLAVLLLGVAKLWNWQQHISQDKRTEV